MKFKWLNIIVIKWILGECRHLCCFCQFRNQCEEDYENDLIATIKEIKRRKERCKEDTLKR